MSRYTDTIQDYDTYTPLKNREQTEERHHSRGSTPRTHRLAWDATHRSGKFIKEAWLNESYVAPDKDLPPILAAAHRFESVYPFLTPVVRDGERIIGPKSQSNEDPSWGWAQDGSGAG